MKGFTADMFFKEHRDHSTTVKHTLTCEEAARIANSRLPALLEAEINRRLSEAETVYGNASSTEWTPYAPGYNDSHPFKAKLLAVTEIGWDWEKKE